MQIPTNTTILGDGAAYFGHIATIVVVALLVFVAALSQSLKLIRRLGSARRLKPPFSVLGSLSSALGSVAAAEPPRLVNGRFTGEEELVVYVNWRGQLAEADVVGFQPEGLVLREKGNKNAQTFFRSWSKVFPIGGTSVAAPSAPALVVA